MYRISVLLLLAGTLALAQRSAPDNSTYVGDSGCRQCHAGVFERYRPNAMSQSFQRIDLSTRIEDWKTNNRFFHKASNQHFEMSERDGRFFQRRFQLDNQGNEIHNLEVEIDFAIGSGRHERDYLHRSPSGEFLQLPVVWYSAEKAWGMAPGYDRADHEGFSRRINYRCVFCHVSYPSVAPGADKSEMQLALFPKEMPSGIGCERCHGPGARHVTAQTAATIVNPARLERKLRMDACMQCHLETTSRPLPNSVVKVGRSVFSYRPGEALQDYAAYFDYPGGSDEFNIVHQAYRLRQSQCFIKSDMTCLTCHNPHGRAAGYNATCAGCHTASSIKHDGDCVTCHMPKRRTDDVVHVIMTDHLIQRRLPKDPLRMKTEPKHDAYAGQLALYLPEKSADLFTGLGLIRGANIPAGLQLLQKLAGSSADVLFQMAAGYASAGQTGRANATYSDGLQRDPGNAEARYNAALSLMKSGSLDSAAEELRTVIRLKPEIADARVALGTIEMKRGRADEARKQYLDALELDPFNTLALNNLGLWNASRGNTAMARAYFEQVLRINPRDTTAQQALRK
jgi:Flp pilus assembly protein TadD